MRELPVLRDLWENSNGLFVGDNKPHGRVTVEPDWYLNTTGETYGASGEGPYRYFWYADQSQTEVEVPNIRSINWSRDIDQDAATCTIEMYNIAHETVGATPVYEGLGQPGYYGHRYGSSGETQARYGQTANSWADVLVPNALIRTFQGYGGFTAGVPDSIDDAVFNGNLVLTGIWLIDRVSMGTDGMMRLDCRDTGKLLVDQKIYPPLVPDQLTPLKYCYVIHETIPGSPGTPGSPAVPPTVTGGGPVGVSYLDSSMNRWYPSLTSLHGYNFNAVADGNSGTISISEGTYSSTVIFARNFWEVSVNAEVNEIYIDTRFNSFGMTWISVMEDGVWLGSNDIPWDDGNSDGFSDSLASGQPGSQPAIGPGIDIPYLMSTSVPNGGVWIQLPTRAIVTPTGDSNTNVYSVQKLRITTTPTWNSGIGPYVYRSACAEINARNVVSANDGTAAVPATPETASYQVDHPGNITSYTQVVHDLLLWSGFLFYEGGSPSGTADVHGLLEWIGAWPDTCINEDYFDKKSVIEVINGIKEILGFIFFIDEEGGARFHEPNFWATGNQLDDGTRTTYVHELTDDLSITTYSSTYSDELFRSQIIVGSTNPSEEADTTEYSIYRPEEADLLRGMVKPAMWINEVFQDRLEQAITAALIGLHSKLRSLVGQVSIHANPEIQINDQVRITERSSSESYIHYVRGISCSMDLDSGTYTMSLTTNWLGEELDWSFNREFFLTRFLAGWVTWGVDVGRAIYIDSNIDVPFTVPNDPVGGLGSG